MRMLDLKELLTKALPKDEWVHLGQVVGLLREVDPDFSATEYGFEKLLPMLQSLPDVLSIKQNDSVSPPSYRCQLKDNVILDNNVIRDSLSYSTLYSKSKLQQASEIFAHFGWNEENGESWDTPYERLANMVKPEPWNFNREAFKKPGQDYIILKNYLNYTFLRLQEQQKIAYSEDNSRACFNTGLQTTSEKDVYAVFYRNKQAVQYKRPAWTFYAFVDSYSHKIKDFQPLPEVATYIEDSSDLVFDLSYELEINSEHIIETNLSRLPDQLKENRRLALTAIQGATQFLKEKIRRNYKVAIPHWYHDKIQLLLPLNLLSDDKADLALVADRDKERKIYRIKTALTMDMAYIDARLICRPDRDWLNP